MYTRPNVPSPSFRLVTTYCCLNICGVSAPERDETFDTYGYLPFLNMVEVPGSLLHMRSIFKFQSRTDFEHVAVAQQITSAALADQRSIPESPIPGDIFHVGKRRNFSRCVMIEYDCVDSEVSVRNDRVVDNVLTAQLSVLTPGRC